MAFKFEGDSWSCLSGLCVETSWYKEFYGLKTARFATLLSRIERSPQRNDIPLPSHVSCEGPSESKTRSTARIEPGCYHKPSKYSFLLSYLAVQMETPLPLLVLVWASTSMGI